MTERGWFPDVEHIRAAEQGYADLPAGTMRPRAVISHIMQGYQPTMIRWARSPSNDFRSAHFSIGRGGRIVQHVGIFDAAWHAGRVESPTWPLYRSVNPNRETIGIEHEGFSIDPVDYPYDYLYSAGRPWPLAMVEASIKVQRWIFEHPEVDMKPSTLTIIGHRETATRSRANDPGSQWPQRQIIGGVLLSALPPALSLRNPRFRAYIDALRRRGGQRVTPLRTDERYDYYELRVRRDR